MNVMVGIRCSEEQKARWQAEADSQDRTLSNWLARVADAACCMGANLEVMIDPSKLKARDPLPGESYFTPKTKIVAGVVEEIPGPVPMKGSEPPKTLPQSGLSVRLAPNGESRIYTYAGVEKVFRFRSDLQKESIIPPALRAEADGMWDGAK